MVLSIKFYCIFWLASCQKVKNLLQFDQQKSRHGLFLVHYIICLFQC